MAEASILNSTKKALGLDADYVDFDVDIIMSINTILSVVNQLGVGPADGYRIDDATATWADLYGAEANYNMIQTYVYLRVRLLFDPPQSQILVTSMENQYKELEWRINSQREGAHWTKPIVAPSDLPDNFVLDGGLAR